MPTLFPDRLGGSVRISEKVAFLVAHGSSDDSVPVELVRAVRIPTLVIVGGGKPAILS